MMSRLRRVLSYQLCDVPAAFQAKISSCASLFCRRRYLSTRAYIALGSNVGDRVRAMHAALRALAALPLVRLLDTSHLYETPPMYVTDQPVFLNAVCVVDTELDPVALLGAVKRLEESLGRQKSFVNGPRSIDLDILLHGQDVVATPTLTVPHPRLHERAFVLRPLHDLAPALVHPLRGTSVARMLAGLSAADRASVHRVSPLGRAQDGSLALVDLRRRVLVMGILNATPDSFSDGGRHNSPEQAAAHAEAMMRDGADMIDVGGESTRPGAAPVSLDEELSRVVPVIERIRSLHPTCLISVDTRTAAVARAAVQAGASLINDVSAGRHDGGRLLAAAAELEVPVVFMHSRGSPQTMDALAQYSGDLVAEVGAELRGSLAQCWQPRWMQYVDPGIGFAKTHAHNLELLRPANLARFRELLGDRPLLVGASRKRFIKTIVSQGSATSDVPSVNDLDWGTAAANCAAVAGGASIVRVHNVRAARNTCDVMRSIYTL